jgi:hypothetical protein
MKVVHDFRSCYFQGLRLPHLKHTFRPRRLGVPIASRIQQRWKGCVGGIRHMPMFWMSLDITERASRKTTVVTA